MESFTQLRQTSGLTSPRQRANELALSFPLPLELLKKPKPEFVVGRAVRVAFRFLAYVLVAVKLPAVSQIE